MPGVDDWDIGREDCMEGVSTLSFCVCISGVGRKEANQRMSEWAKGRYRARSGHLFDTAAVIFPNRTPDESQLTTI